MSDLLPCPFCGGEAQVQHQSRELYGDAVDWYGVYCKKQFCGYVSGQSTEAEAIEAWNTRAERTCHADEVTHRDCKYSVNRGWKERTCKMEQVQPPKIMAGWYRCSTCGDVYPPCNPKIASWALQYCPRCGAKVVSE